MDTAIVYVRTDSESNIIAINSSNYLNDISGWIQIDSGVGDKYVHADNYYLPEPIMANEDPPIPRYKLVDGLPVLRSEEEIAADSVPDLDALRAAKQEANKAALADWLAAHPLTWTDGNVYGVTEEDQNEMAINLAQYQLAVAAEQSAVLEWHAQK